MSCRVLHDLLLSRTQNEINRTVLSHGACLQCYCRPYHIHVETRQLKESFQNFFYAIFGSIQGISRVDLVEGSSEVFSFLYPCRGYILARSSQRTLENISDPIKYMYSKSTSTKESKKPCPSIRLSVGPCVRLLVYMLFIAARAGPDRYIV